MLSSGCTKRIRWCRWLCYEQQSKDKTLLIFWTPLYSQPAHFLGPFCCIVIIPVRVVLFCPCIPSCSNGFRRSGESNRGHVAISFVCRDMGVFINKGVYTTRFPLLHVKLIPLKKDFEVHDAQWNSEYSSRRLAIVKGHLFVSIVYLHFKRFLSFCLLHCSATALTLLYSHTFFFLLSIVALLLSFSLHALYLGYAWVIKYSFGFYACVCIIVSASGDFTGPKELRKNQKNKTTTHIGSPLFRPT